MKFANEEIAKAMTIEEFIIADLRLRFYESYPDDYKREIYEYRKLIDFYIQNNLKEDTKAKKQPTQQEIKNYRKIHNLKSV